MPIRIVTRRPVNDRVLFEEFLTVAANVLGRAKNYDGSLGAGAAWPNGPDKRVLESSSPKEPTGTRDSADYQLELAKFLWEEFKYRHDLIWRLLFRVTLVAVGLSIAPFTISDLVGKRASFWVQFLPALAIALVVASWWLLWVEYRLFRPVNDRYVKAQRKAVGKRVREAKTFDFFKWTVRLYPIVLLILTTTVGCIVWVNHIPSLGSPPIPTFM
jgi:hypothetical protein